MKAIALYSGGLDSTLAVLAVLKQGIEVTAVTFLNHFGCEISDKSSCSKDPFAASTKFGFEVKLCHLADKFIEIVKNPKFGHGRNMNPCIDCRILMLKEAKVLLEMTGAEFIISGEVLGQRPMSQRRDAMDIIDREAGVKGLVLRPLSAKLLKPTLAEEKGLINRSLLYAMSGRSRKPQMALAEEFGLSDYPAPAGGCLLTEPNFSYRVSELLSHDPDPSTVDLQLLRIGRHFRLNPGCKVVIGRDQEENDRLISLCGDYTTWLRVPGYGSPVALIIGEPGDSGLAAAASLCVRYSDARHLMKAAVMVTGHKTPDGSKNIMIEAVPAGEEAIEGLMIGRKKGGKARSVSAVD